MRSFDYQPRTRLVFGADSVERVGELAREIGAKKVLLVTDPGIVAAGHEERVRNILASAHLQVTVFNQGSVLVEDAVENIMRNPQVRDIYLGKQAAA